MSASALLQLALAAFTAAIASYTVAASAAEMPPVLPPGVVPPPPLGMPPKLPEPELLPLLVEDGCRAAYSEAFAWARSVSAFSRASLSSAVLSRARTSPACTSSPMVT